MLETGQQFRRIFAVIGCLWALGHASAALALGFGDIQLASGLNAPLDARIELASLSGSERRSLSVQIASQALFERFGIKRTAFADEVRIDVMEGRRSNSVMLHLTTRRAVREPFLQFLLEADTADGRALREYTVLLDPPSRSPITAEKDSSTATPQVALPRPGAPRQQAPTSTNVPDNRYGPVKPGDTLYSIAAHLQRPGTTLDQMQVAIFRENPQAFGNSINMLLRGTMLSIPAQQQITAIGHERASDIVREQRQATVAAPSSESSESPTPRMVDRASEKRDTTGARLRLAAPETLVPMNPTEGAAASDETFGRLVEPDSSMSVDRKPAHGSTTIADDPAAAQPVTVALVESSTGAKTLDRALEVPATLDNEPVTKLPAGAVQVAAGNSAPLEAAPELEVVPRSGGGLLSPRNLLLLVLGVLLLVMLSLWYRRRQYKPVPLDFTATIEQEAPVEAATGQAMPEPTPSIEENQALEPEAVMADADQQIKAGLFDQARNILHDGLCRYPEHTGLQDKRLELDYLVGDAEQFARDVDRFHHALVANGVRWAGITAMGRILSPDDRRFALDAGVSDVGVAQAPETPATAVDNGQSPTQPIAGAPCLASDSLRESVLDDDASSSVQRQASEPPEPDESPAAAEPGIEADTLAGDDAQAQDNTFGAEIGTDEDEASLCLDTKATDLSIYEWQDQAVPSGDTREHDRSEEAGLSFDLDMSEFSDYTAPQPLGTAAAGAQSDEPSRPTPIDADDYDLGVSDTAATATDGDNGDPVDIRLDLARMYLEMEDHEAARELLEEALADGNEKQQEAARTLLNQYSR